MRERFRRFMMGRSGMDKFNSLLFTLFLLFTVISVAMDVFLGGRGGLWTMAIACFGFGLFRFLSRNTARRHLENLAFLQLWSRVEVWWSRIWIRYRSRKQFVVLTCPDCSLKQRAPRGKGHIRIKCKQCKATFDART